MRVICGRLGKQISFRPSMFREARGHTSCIEMLNHSSPQSELIHWSDTPFSWLFGDHFLCTIQRTYVAFSPAHQSMTVCINTRIPWRCFRRCYTSTHVFSHCGFSYQNIVLTQFCGLIYLWKFKDASNTTSFTPCHNLSINSKPTNSKLLKQASLWSLAQTTRDILQPHRINWT